MTLKNLPNFEMFDVGNQMRKSSKSVKSTIVAGYGRRRYKPEYMLNNFIKSVKKSISKSR